MGLLTADQPYEGRGAQVRCTSQFETPSNDGRRRAEQEVRHSRSVSRWAGYATHDLTYDASRTLNTVAAQAVESLLNADGKLANRRDDDDRLPIHWATSHNRLPIVQILSERKDFDVDAQDGSGWTPLMMASSLKDGEAVTDLLLAKGADTNEKTNNGQTALHFASSKSNLDIAKKLLAHKASARTKDKRGQLPLHRAAAVGNVPMLKLLLDNRSPVNATDMDACTPLHHAIAEGHADAAVALLKAGAETDKKDSTGALAIALAPDARIRSYIERAAAEEGIELTPG